MFTGIIEAIGTIERLDNSGDGVRVTIHTGKLQLGDVALGDSIAVNGVCLTVIELLSSGFIADVSKETLARTGFSQITPGYPVNLEKAMKADGRFGGHIVSGHVDGVGKVLSRRDDGRFIRFAVEAPAAIQKYIAEKGSICVDGVSLTVNGVTSEGFELTIVPHTLQETIMGQYRSGTRVNLEVDIIARYLERLMSAQGDGRGEISLELLKNYGYLGDG